MYGAVAAGVFSSIQAATAALPTGVSRVYTPDPEHVAIYEKLYGEYMTLHAYFGEQEGMMARLSDMRRA